MSGRPRIRGAATNRPSGSTIRPSPGSKPAGRPSGTVRGRATSRDRSGRGGAGGAAHPEIAERAAMTA